MTVILLIACGGCFFGLFLAIAWDFFEKKSLLHKVRMEGEHILQESQEKSETLLERAQSDFEKKKQAAYGKFEPEREKYQNSIQQLQSKIDKKKHELTLKSKEQDKHKSLFTKELENCKSNRKKFQKTSEGLFSELRKKEQELKKKIEEHFSIDSQKIKTELKAIVEESWKKELSKKMEKYEEEQSQILQKNARFYLNVALNRFERAYCPRRTIEPVHFRNIKALSKVVGKDNANIKEMEKECGVDMLVNEEDFLIQIFGIDPVRRELGRITLTYFLKNNQNINSQKIKEVVKKCKKTLFETIKRDGKTICKNLKLKNVAPEVQSMMGALKYRYSFAQNQHYHCEEVGWLCGLLNSEFNLPTKKGNRAGMFHDIGKAMDHSIEGSHAVIGADFLSKYSEDEDVLHAVRAHHHDETPSTPLAYLVIAADAISGSRPGARRFTEDSYSKKLASLERIIDSFKHIEDSYIMSAGREMRVVVNNEKVTDQEALDLSQKIARQIEKECSYPGLIKVTVVRHSESVSIAK